MQPDAPSGVPLTPAIVFENLQAFQRTFALKAAIELDVFRAVGQGPGDVSSIARHASASERGIRILCDFLVVSGLLQKVDGHYRHTPSSAAFQDPSSPFRPETLTHFLALSAPATRWGIPAPLLAGLPGFVCSFPVAPGAARAL